MRRARSRPASVDITRAARPRTSRRIAEALRRQGQRHHGRHPRAAAPRRPDRRGPRRPARGSSSSATATSRRRSRCAVSGTGVHAVMGIGGAPEGVITAAALRCLGGEIQARFRYPQRRGARARRAKMGHGDEDRVYRTEDLAPRREPRLRRDRRDRPATCSRASGSSAAARGPTRSSWPTRPSRSGSSTRSTCSTATARRPSGSRATGTQPSPSQVAIGRAASAPSAATRRSARGRDGLAPARRDEPRREVGERREHEQPVARLDVRDDERHRRLRRVVASGPRAGAPRRSGDGRTRAGRGPPRAAPSARAPGARTRARGP